MSPCSCDQEQDGTGKGQHLRRDCKAAEVLGSTAHPSVHPSHGIGFQAAINSIMYSAPAAPPRTAPIVYAGTSIAAAVHAKSAAIASASASTAAEAAANAALTAVEAEERMEKACEHANACCELLRNREGHSEVRGITPVANLMAITRVAQDEQAAASDCFAAAAATAAELWGVFLRKQALSDAAAAQAKEVTARIKVALQGLATGDDSVVLPRLS